MRRVEFVSQQQEKHLNHLKRLSHSLLLLLPGRCHDLSIPPFTWSAKKYGIFLGATPVLSTGGTASDRTSPDSNRISEKPDTKQLMAIKAENEITVENVVENC